MVTVEIPHPSGRLTVLATDDDALLLPGTPGLRLSSIWEALTAQERRALKPHLIGTTSADWLAFTLQSAGHSISATTIKTYRRSLQ